MNETTDVVKLIPNRGMAILSNWILGPDGDLYQYIYSDDWRVLTDKEVGKVMGGDRWFAVAYRDGEPLLIVPGCRIDGFLACRPEPFRNTWLDLTETSE